MIPQLLGQWQHFLDDLTADLSLVLQHVAPLATLLFLALWYCNGVLPAVGHTCFLCSGAGGVASLVPLIFGVFYLVASDGEVVCIGLENFCSLLLDSSSESTLGGGAVWSCTLGSLVVLFIRESGRVGSASLFGILVSTSKIWANSLIYLSWASFTWKCDSGLGVCKAFARSAAAWMATSLVL